MPKDDPLQQTKTLWLDRDANEIARERYFRAWWQQVAEDQTDRVAMVEERCTWDTAWAAAVAVHSFIAEGRLGPPVDDETAR